MRRTSSFLVALALAAGCSFDVDYGDTQFRCKDTSDCPDGLACVAQECHATGGDGAPTAAFTSDSSFLLVSLDGTSSTDPDGDELDHAWSFGDDSTGTGDTISHTYDAEGTYEVTLTVTDDDGNTDSVSNEVSVTAPPQPLAQDDFERSLEGAWGSADVGGPWSLNGTADLWRVDGRGHVDVAAGMGPAAYLTAIETDSVDIAVTLAAAEVATGSGLYLSLMGRKVSAGNTYELTVVLRPDGNVGLDLSKHVSGDETALDQMTIPGLTYAPGTLLRARAQFFGTAPTTMRARVWAAGDEEPGEWQLDAEDAEPILQVPADPGLNSYLSSSATNGPIEVTYDDLVMVPVE